MKIAVLGATGPTGQEVVKQALEQGHTVTALVRDPDKMASQVQHDNLQIQKVDLSKEEDLVGPMKGVDAVLSSLGSRAGIWTPCSLYTDSIVTITGAMRKGGVNRLICVTSWGSKDEPGLPWIISWFLKPTFLRNILANMGEMEDYMQEKCTDINYTVVRPPGLSNQPSCAHLRSGSASVMTFKRSLKAHLFSKFQF
nr:hypothetical protein BaRGS_019795 [Batillaria attramentaria]